MSRVAPVRVLALAILSLAAPALSGPSALAQAAGKAASAPTAPPAAPAEPAATTASFGDWVLRCQRVADGDKAVRVCEVAQAMQIQGQSAPIAQVAFLRPPGEDAMRLVAVVPVSVSFAAGVRMAADEKDGKDQGAAELAWRRCLSGGCVADNPVKDDQLKRWRTASETGKLTFRDALGRELSIPLSFRGLAAALDAYAKERS